MITFGIIAASVIAALIIWFVIGTKKGVDELDEAPKPPQHDTSRDDVCSPR